MSEYLTREDVLSIPACLMPMPVLSDNLRNVVSAGIKAHTHGCYGHFMWLIEPGILASMGGSGFKKIPLDDFLPDNRLKFWWGVSWSAQDREKIKTAIRKELADKWWQGNRYDFLSYIGHLTGWRWIQSPWADVCSDKAKYIAMVDPAYNLQNPDPEDVNRWLENNKPRYQIYGRYTPD